MTSALIEIRLSNETEESTSPERQCDQISAIAGKTGLGNDAVLSLFQRGPKGQ
jgi:hypothetical protein